MQKSAMTVVNKPLVSTVSGASSIRRSSIHKQMGGSGSKKKQIKVVTAGAQVLPIPKYKEYLLANRRRSQASVQLSNKIQLTPSTQQIEVPLPATQDHSPHGTRLSKQSNVLGEAKAKGEKDILRSKFVKKHDRMATSSQDPILTEQEKLVLGPDPAVSRNSFLRKDREEKTGGSLHFEKEQQEFKRLVNPNGAFKTYWETSKFLIMMYILLYLPLRSTMIEDEPLFFYVIEKVIDVYFFVDIVLNFFTPVYIHHELILNRASIAKDYLQGWFAFDVLALFPFEEIVASLQDSDPNFQVLARFSKGLRLLRLTKLVRLFKALDFTNSDNLILKLLDKNFKGTVFYLLLPNIILMGFTLHMLSCFWYYLAYSCQDNTDWIEYNGFSNKPLLDLYIISFYFVVQSFTSCGYGDIYSIRNSEIVYRCFIVISGALLYTMFAGRIIEYRNQKVQEDDIYDQKMDALERIEMSGILIPDRVHLWLQESLREHKKDVKKRAYDFSNLSQEDINELDYLKFISKFRNLPLFGSKLENAYFVLALGRKIERVRYKAEEMIYARGDMPTHFYILFSGKVAMVMNKVELIPVYAIKKGFFGEFEIIREKPREHSVVALEDTILYRIGVSDFKYLFLNDRLDPDLHKAIIDVAFARRKKINEMQYEFDFWLRRKIFWKLALPKRSRKTKAMRKILKDAEKGILPNQPHTPIVSQAVSLLAS